MYRSSSFVIIAISLVMMSCSIETSEEGIVESAPQCPAASSANYVGCWEATCREVGYIEDERQWERVRYYFTEDGKFFDFRWVYTVANCAGDVDFTDNGQSIRLLTFSDPGVETLPSGVAGHKLAMSSHDGNQVFDVLTAVSDAGRICFSENLDVRGLDPAFTLHYRDGTAVDFNNCLDKVAQ